MPALVLWLDCKPRKKSIVLDNDLKITRTGMKAKWESSWYPVMLIKRNGKQTFYLFIYYFKHFIKYFGIGILNDE